MTDRKLFDPPNRNDQRQGTLASMQIEGTMNDINNCEENLHASNSLFMSNLNTSHHTHRPGTRSSLNRAKSGMFGEVNRGGVKVTPVKTSSSKTSSANIDGDIQRTSTMGSRKPTGSPTTLKAKMETRANNLGLFYGVISEEVRHVHHMEQFKGRCLVIPNTFFRRFWDILTLSLLLYVALFTPIQIAFYGETMSMTKWRDWVVIYVMDRVVDAIFIIDIIINFRTAWFDPSGEVEFDQKRAAIDYAKSWLILDVISCFPFDFISPPEQTGQGIARLPKLIRLLRLAKIAKVLRMSRILRRFESSMHIKYGIVRLTKFFLWSLVAAHWVGCAWFIIGTLDTYEGWVVSNLLSTELHGASVGEQYIASVYWSVMTLTTIGYGDVSPNTAAERLFAILCMLLGSAMFAYVVGTMCSVVQGLSETALAFQYRMDRINEYMTECKLPSSLRGRVRKYCLYQRDANLIRAEERRLLSTLSPALRSEISSFNYEKPLRSAQYFYDAPREFIHSLSEFLSLAIFGPNEAIIRMGFTGSKMYILAKGRCQIEWADAGTGNVRIIGEITDGSCFGELAMLFQSRRSATVRTLNFCETLYLRRDNYMMVAHHFPYYAKKVRKAAIKVMWTNMLTSNTLKAALIRAAEARDRANEEAARMENTVSDLTDQMHSIMQTMTERLSKMEDRAHEEKEERDKAWVLQENKSKEIVETLEKDNRSLKRRLTVQLKSVGLEEAVKKVVGVVEGEVGEKVKEEVVASGDVE